MLGLTLSDITIQDKTLTTISWDTIFYGRGVDTDFTSIYTPKNYNSCRISGRLTYDVGSIGTRLLRIYKNNTDIIPNMSWHVNGATSGHTSIPYTTPVLEIVSEDTFQLMAYQNSGAPLKILQIFTPYFFIEFGMY